MKCLKLCVNWLTAASESTMNRIIPRIFALGDIAWDILLRPEEPLVFGSDVPGKAEFTPGGSAANFAVWAACLEAEVLLQGKIGDDRLGKMMEEHLARKKVGLRLQIVTGARTARIGAVVSLQGERAFVMDKPTSLAFSLGDFDTTCLLYTSDAADDLLCVDLGGSRIIKKKKSTANDSPNHTNTNNNTPPTPSTK